MASKNLPTRDRIVNAAAKLFQGEGVRDVSVDMVAAEAGLTKRTLYYHFRSKDDVIAAYLQARDQPNLAMFKRWFYETDGGLAEKVEGIFRNLALAARHPKWKGCGFLRTSVELVKTPGHPAVLAARTHKKRVEDWLCTELAKAGLASSSQAAARQIILLLDGSFSTVLLHRDPSYMEAAGDAARRLIHGYLPPADTLDDFSVSAPATPSRPQNSEPGRPLL
ncbi:TetR/AcrR family transcriptional regulator [Nitratireductor soli]|uniref:TetR/AcrR family transcriptional regulator n=1 Tax=Nitratireductor soli TaxID=1670619 RepID=UPI0009E249AD|nr:TetR/AcrR family transcriptional regulator [Nitratireductor soli]